MKITLTGSEGFIGSHFDMDCEKVDLKLGTDICDLKEVGDVVIHLAAVSSIPESFEKPEETMRTNIVGTQHLIRLCEESGAKLIFASSASVKNPLSPYALSKKWGEEMIRQAGIEYVILRLGNVFGEGDDKSAVAKFKRQNRITIYGDGNQVRSFVHVEDVIDAIKMGLGVRGEFAIATETMSINELAKLFRNHLSVHRQSARRGDAKDLSLPTFSAGGWTPKTSIRDWINA